MAAIDKFYINSWEKYAELRDFFTSCGEVIDNYGNKFRPISFLWKNEEQEFKDWVNNVAKHVQETYDNGGYKWSLENGYMTQEEYDNFKAIDHASVPIMNTPIFFDVWMIRNCQHIKWLQEQLIDKYSGGYSKLAFADNNNDDEYYQILNHTSIYDTYKRNGVGKNIKMKKCRLKKDTYHIKKAWFTFELEDTNKNEYWYYLESQDYWCCDKELKIANGWTSSMAHVNKDMSWKAIYRKLCKWNLPEGMKVNITRWYICRHTNKRYADDFELIIEKK